MKMEPSSSLSEADDLGDLGCQNCRILEQRLDEALRMRDQLIRSEEFAWQKVEELQKQLNMFKSFLDD